MTTWTRAIRHPWFNPPTMKRRLSANDADDDDSSFPSDVSPSTFSTSRQKRVRYDSLERTLAHMTLGGPSEDVDMWPKTSLPRPGVQGALNVILPSSVEEPGAGTPMSEHVDMEVEPASVIAAAPLSNAIDDWESIKSWQLDIKEVQISSAVLERLRRQTKCPPPLMPLSSQTPQALVLYRPPRPLEQVCDHEEEKSTRRSHEDAVMEVE